MSAGADAMVVTDLDGTLLDSKGRLSAANREALDLLGRRGVVRVVATGRNLHSALQAMPPDTPIDYLVFGSGAGTLRWSTRELLHAEHLEDDCALEAAARLMALGLDFMLHAAVPDNHRFWYHRATADNADFERRVHRYRDFCAPWPAAAPAGPFSQLLAVQAPGARTGHADLVAALEPLNVVRTTSPLACSTRSEADASVTCCTPIASSACTCTGTGANVSNSREWAITTAGTGPQGLMPMGFTRQGLAIMVSDTGMELRGAGFQPETAGGPLMAIDDTGTSAGWTARTRAQHAARATRRSRAPTRAAARWRARRARAAPTATQTRTPASSSARLRRALGAARAAAARRARTARAATPHAARSRPTASNTSGTRASPSTARTPPSRAPPAIARSSGRTPVAKSKACGTDRSGRTASIATVNRHPREISR